MGMQQGGSEVISSSGKGKLAGVYPGNYNISGSVSGISQGDIVYDATKDKCYFWDNTRWRLLGFPPTSAFLSVSVSTNSNVIISDSSANVEGTWRTLYCKASTTIYVNSFAQNRELNKVKYFIVGGGGGSGSTNAGGTVYGSGAGAGGVIEGILNLSLGANAITVGSGAALSNIGVGNAGGVSRVGAVRAEGGGGGWHYPNDRGNSGKGASGGGSFYYYIDNGQPPTTPLSGNKIANTNTDAYSPQGHAGGLSMNGSYRNGGGGGGAGAPGGNGVNGLAGPGDGGIGIQAPHWVSTSYGDGGWFGGGGGGGWEVLNNGNPSGNSNGGDGGRGGGGYGMNARDAGVPSGKTINGLSNTGGGGGGKSNSQGNRSYGPGGTGGSGFVALSWRIG